MLIPFTNSKGIIGINPKHVVVVYKHNADERTVIYSKNEIKYFVNEPVDVVIEAFNKFER